MYNICTLKILFMQQFHIQFVNSIASHLYDTKRSVFNKNKNAVLDIYSS